MRECLGLRLRCRREFSAPLLWCQCQHSGEGPSTLRELFHHSYSGTSHCTVGWPAQLCLQQEILPAHLYWTQTALRKALHQPGKDLCICSVVPPSFPKPCFPIFSLVTALVTVHLAVSKKLSVWGQGMCMCVCVWDFFCAGSAHWCSQVHSWALLKLTQKRRGNTQQDPGLSLAQTASQTTFLEWYIQWYLIQHKDHWYKIIRSDSFGLTEKIYPGFGVSYHSVKKCLIQY